VERVMASRYHLLNRSPPRSGAQSIWETSCQQKKTKVGKQRGAMALSIPFPLSLDTV
jgi:hypothetical protein